jgi:hypothetical protein
VSVAVTSGANVWSLTPASCVLTSGATCAVTVTFDPPSTGVHLGTLVVSGPGGNQSVSLAGWQAPPLLAISANHLRVSAHHRAEIHGMVMSYGAKLPLGGQRVLLERRGRSGRWRLVASGHTGPLGHVTFGVTPGSATTYRLVASAADGAHESHSLHLHIGVG